ncbi:MAG TPA: HAMP domain-containing sensor histidine kinase, partial [Candidatus Obscuribacterales bacterium]
PLAAILMAAENLCNLADVLTPDQVQRKIQRIRERAGQLHYIVNDILVLTQIDAGHIRFHPEACRVAELCDDIIEEVLLATQHTHKVHVAHAEPGLQARLDKNLMRIMLSNLLHNAIKFSFDSPEVWLRILPQAEALHFEVEDRGIGITSEELPHLFEPFYRSDRVIFSTSGSGLGLELVQRALQIHQGEIEITRLEQGSLFRLGIPLRT